MRFRKSHTKSQVRLSFDYHPKQNLKHKNPMNIPCIMIITQMGNQSNKN